MCLDRFKRLGSSFVLCGPVVRSVPLTKMNKVGLDGDARARERRRPINVATSFSLEHVTETRPGLTPSRSSLKRSEADVPPLLPIDPINHHNKPPTFNSIDLVLTSII